MFVDPPYGAGPPPRLRRRPSLTQALSNRGYGAFPSGGPVRRPVGGGFAVGYGGLAPHALGQQVAPAGLAPNAADPSGAVPPQPIGLTAAGGPMMGGPGAPASGPPLPHPSGTALYPWNTPQPWHVISEVYGQRRPKPGGPMMGGPGAGLGMALAQRRPRRLY